MPEKLYYEITALPTLGPLGSEPSLRPAELLARLAHAPQAHRLLEALLLSDDLLQRESVQAGETEHPEPIVLSEAQLRGELPLPDSLQPEPGQREPRVPADALWQRYYRHTAELAEAGSSGFLADWVQYEVGLRNAMVAARAKALDLEPSEYTVCEDLGREEQLYDAAVSEWAAAADPLAGLRALDRRRWEWIESAAPSYSFEVDEILAYAAKLMLLSRWERLEAAAERAGT